MFYGGIDFNMDSHSSGTPLPELHDSSKPQNSVTKSVSLVLFFILSTVGAISICVYLTHTVFFDQFMYQKSHAYGYFVENSNNDYSLFGKRSEDIAQLYPLDEEGTILGVSTLDSTDDEYLVVVLGDSVVWGQGILNRERFVTKLEKKLNQTRKAKVVSLAVSGDSLFDNYVKYNDWNSKNRKADLYLVGLVENDLMFKEYEQLTAYPSQEIERLADECSGPLHPGSDINGEYRDLVQKSWSQESKNFCVFQKLLPILPKEKVLYVNMGYTYAQNSEYALFDTFFTQHNLPYVTFNDYLQSKISKEKLNSNWGANLYVSKTDGHPSAYANTLYADFLYQEIVNTPEYGFQLD